MKKFLDIECDDDCHDKGHSTSNFLIQYDASNAIKKENESAQILTLYKQLKLQRELDKCEFLEKGAKESMMYTNYRLINDIAETIEQTNVDYPKSYQTLTKSDISNTILTSIQLKNQHMQTNPLARGP